MLLPPPQLAIVIPARINRAAVANTRLDTRLRRRSASVATTIRRTAAMMTTGNRNSLRGSNRDGGTSEFAVVVTVTVAVSAAPEGLELTTNGLTGSFVATVQLAFGAVVAQER